MVYRSDKRRMWDRFGAGFWGGRGAKMVTLYVITGMHNTFSPSGVPGVIAARPQQDHMTPPGNTFKM